jgi:uncharacterized protein
MSRGIIRMGLVLCVILCGLTVRAGAQQQQEQQLTPEKRALIKELQDAINAPGSVQAVMDAILSQSEESSEQIINESISEIEGLTQQEKEELRQKTASSSARINKRFRELLPQRIDLPKALADISYSVYDRYFTEEEIKALIAFYRSPVGKKSIEVMPKLFADSMTQAAEILTPKVKQLIKEITDEEIKNNETKPQPAGQPDTRHRQ